MCFLEGKVLFCKDEIDKLLNIRSGYGLLSDGSKP